MAGPDRARQDVNLRPTLIAVSNADGESPVTLWADPTTHQLIISGTFSAGSLTNNNAAPAANNQGVLPAIANAAPPSYTEGYQVLLSTDLSGALRVTGSLSIGGTTDNSAFTAGSSSGTPALGFYHSTIDTVTDGRAATIAITNKRGQHVNIRDASGNELGISSAPLQVSIANTGANATAVKVDGSAVTQPVSLTSTTITGSVTVVGGKTHNNAAPGANNVGALVGIANAAAPTYTEGDQVLLSTDLSGALRITGSLSIGGTTDNSAFTAGTSTGTPAMGFFHSTIDAVTDGRAAALAIDAKRNLFTVLRDAAGNARGANVNASNQLSVSVDNNPVLGAGSAVIGHVIVDSGAITATLSAETTKVIGTVRTADGAGNLLLSAANALNSTGAGILATQLVAQFDDSSPTSITENQFGNVRMSSNRNLYGTIRDAAGNERGANVTSANELLVNVNTIAAGTNVIGHVITDSGSVVTATLSAETTKVIGVVRNADGSGNLLTSTGAALDVNLKTSSITLPVSIAGTVTISGAVTEATLDAALIAQEATTSGVKGLTAFGAVTTNAPTYVTAKSDALSLTPAGGLRIDLKDSAANTNAFNVSLAAETTKVIGVTRTADGAGNLLTSNSTTFTAKFGLDVNMLGTLGTAFSTAGKVDVKGADGDVFVRQATAANFNATVVGTGTFAVQATLAAETTKVIGVTRSADGSGNLLTSTGNALDVNIKTSAASNISTNLAQVNGVTTLAGNGASGTGAQRVTIASDSTGQVAPAANATATGTSIYNNTALSSTKQAVNASAGNLYGYHIYNPNSVVIYVQLFNLASASVTVGTTAPTAVLAVPPLGWADAPPSGPPIAFATALTIAATTTSTGSGAPSTALLCNIWYK